MPDPTKLLANINFAGLGNLTGPKELFVMLSLVFIFLYGMSIGKTRALLSLLSIYVALALISLFPFFSLIEANAPENLEPYFLKAGLFFIFYVGSFAVLSYSSMRRLTMGELSIGKVLMISILQVGLIGAVIISFLPEDVGGQLFTPVIRFFGTTEALFFWCLGSLAILPMMRQKRN